jgi:hypothetical protein
MQELNTVEVQGVSGGYGVWFGNGDYLAVYCDGSVQLFKSDGNVLM